MAKSALELLKDYRGIVEGDIQEAPRPITKSVLTSKKSIENYLSEGQVGIKSDEFDSKEEAEKYRDDYYDQYNPAGYSTNIRIKQLENGKWIATGYRYDSCD